MKNKDKKEWLTLNSHGKYCIKSFALALGASDVTTSQIDYLYDKDLIDYTGNFNGDLENRKECGLYALTDLGIATVKHYLPYYYRTTNK